MTEYLEVFMKVLFCWSHDRMMNPYVGLFLAMNSENFPKSEQKAQFSGMIFLQKASMNSRYAMS